MRPILMAATLHSRMLQSKSMIITATLVCCVDDPTEVSRCRPTANQFIDIRSDLLYKNLICWHQAVDLL
jgi:hypothetical protein